MAAWWALTCVQLDAHGAVQMLQEGAVTAGGFQHSASIVAKAQHGPDDAFGGEDLPEAGRVGSNDRRSGC